jgi:hypothetical protein
MLPTSSTVPEEISLPRLWHKCIANHCRAPLELEEGVCTTLEEADMVEVIVSKNKKEKKDDRIGVIYTIGNEPQVYRIWVKGDALVGNIKKAIALAHKGKPIVALASEGADLAEEDAFSDWMTRTGGAPRQLQAKISPLVQVILDWMGTEQQMFAREAWTREEFVSALQTHLGTSHKLEATPLGLNDWAIRAGFMYEIRETRKASLKCQDVDGEKFSIDIAGNKTKEEVCEACRKQWGNTCVGQDSYQEPG